MMSRKGLLALFLLAVVGILGCRGADVGVDVKRSAEIRVGYVTALQDCIRAMPEYGDRLKECVGKANTKIKAEASKFAGQDIDFEVVPQEVNAAREPVFSADDKECEVITDCSPSG